MSRITRRTAALVPATAAALLLGTAGSALAIPNHDTGNPPPPPPNAAPTARLSVSPNPALVSSPILVNAKIAKVPNVGDAVLGRNAVTFDASRSSDPDGTIARYDWDLDGVPGYERSTTTPKVSRTYAQRALITVRVRVVDDGGRSDDTLQVLRVHQAPRAALAATPADITVGGRTTLSAAGSTDDDGIAKYEWDADGNGTFEATTTTPSFQAPPATTVGDRTARVRVTDTNGASSVASTRVGVHAAPNAVYTAAPSPAVVGEQVAFDASDSLVAEPVVRFEWDLDGDGTFETDTGASPKATRAYPAPGLVTTRLRITDRQGAQDVETRTLAVLRREQVPADGTAPSVRVSGSGRMSSTGRVALVLACPASERLCIGRVVLRSRGKAIGSRAFSLGGGQRGTARVLLSRSAQAKVKARGKLAVRATASARDAAGNRGTTTRTLTVRKGR